MDIIESFTVRSFYYYTLPALTCVFDNAKSDPGIFLYIILSRDVPLLKFDSFSWSECLGGLLVDTFRAAEKSNPRRYTCGQELMDSNRVQSFINQCLIHRMIRSD